MIGREIADLGARVLTEPRGLTVRTLHPDRPSLPSLFSSATTLEPAVGTALIYLPLSPRAGR